jgi:hypothetical protein
LIAAATNRAEARTAGGTETTKCTKNPERETRHTPKSESPADRAVDTNNSPRIHLED